MPANFPNSPNINDTYTFNDLTFVYDGSKWKIDGQLTYVQDAIQYIRSGTTAERPTVSAAALYYNTELEGLELYYPEISTWEVVNTFAKQVDPTSATGQNAYTTPGTFTWVCPANVYRVHVVAVGGGGGAAYTGGGGAGGGGGGLGWQNFIPVTPGQSYTVEVGAGGINGTDGGDSYFINTTTVAGFGGTGGADGQATVSQGGSYFPFLLGQGGEGGDGAGETTNGYPFAGGGAGGYSGNGGNATTYTGENGSGGGGGAGGRGDSAYAAGSGGGVGILGEGASGSGGTGSGSAFGGSGTGGSGGANGSAGVGGAYGGGAGASDTGTYNQPKGGDGAVRIIWGPNRSFPSTNTGDL